MELVRVLLFGWSQFCFTDSFLSPKTLKLHNQCPERSGISAICCNRVFQKAIEKYSENILVPAIRKFVLIFLVLMMWQMPEKREVFFPSNQER